MLQWLTAGWLPITQINFGLVLLMALVLECISAFAPLVLATFAAATRRAPSSPVAPGRAEARLVEDGRALSRPAKPVGNIVDFL
ncbi:MAG TPA: hypothetical protein VFI87_07710, partial [Hyphomicrobiaceae bacterium]|nr:hypothetical protein [Hyphomicrobiaceae bacterium]